MEMLKNERVNENLSLSLFRDMKYPGYIIKMVAENRDGIEYAHKEYDYRRGVYRTRKEIEALFQKKIEEWTENYETGNWKMACYRGQYDPNKTTY